MSIIHFDIDGVLKFLIKARENFKRPDGSKLTVVEKFHAILKYRDKCSQQYFFVVDMFCDPLLGYPVLLELEKVQLNNSVDAS